MPPAASPTVLGTVMITLEPVLRGLLICIVKLYNTLVAATTSEAGCSEATVIVPGVVVITDVVVA